MAFATLYSGARAAGLALLLGVGLPAAAVAVEGAGSVQALRTFEQARKAHQDEPKNAAASWKFGRACFELAEFATNKTERAQIAEQGLAACREVVAVQPDSAPGHYYLGLNLGQLARTRGLGALRLVNQMEHEFLRAQELDSSLNYAGPDRALGSLYLDAPTIGSVGSRTKARQHLLRAIELAPRFPENRLNFIEAQVKWDERNGARHDLKELQELLPAVRKEFEGPAWVEEWKDWDSRLDSLEKDLEKQSRAIDSPRGKS